MPVGWTSWMPFSPEGLKMKHRGYTGYHGRRSQQKRWLTLLLIVVLLLGGAFRLFELPYSKA